MTPDPPPPLRFGEYLLTAELGRDALGRVYRALRLSGERRFARLRILESPEISEDSILDAIEENGEIHSFLKDPTIARGVEMGSVEGTPFIAWDEPGGRTLDSLLDKSRKLGQRIPVEHALLIAERVATALEHAYGTIVDEERTLHGLAWPGFVSISDEGETRLVGFGLASGFLPSLEKPHFAREIAPYLAPEEKKERRVGKNSDVYSVGVLLFELLTARLPSADAIPELRGSRESGPIPPAAAALLARCLVAADSRYSSSGELRRELGKLLFSGSSSPSTFNLVFFLSNLFASEIEAEKKARVRESSLDAGSFRQMPQAAIAPEAPATATRPSPVTRRPAGSAPQEGRTRRPKLAVGGALLLTAAVAGGLFLVMRTPSPPTQPIPRLPTRSSAVSLRLSPTPEPAPASPSTTGMSEAEFQQEVARRVAQELKKFERDIEKAGAAPEEARATVERPEPPAPPAGRALAAARAQAVEVSPPVTAVPEAPRPTPPQPTPSASARVESAASQIETPPQIRTVVKPPYPRLALQARIGGIVVLRVLVSETGAPLDVQVLKGVHGGLTEAAVSAVRKWTFEPARKGGVPVQAWTTIPIPFQP